MYDFCELAHLGGCGGGLQTHHVLNRGKLNAIPGWKKYCEVRFPEVFLATVCANHNVNRIADSRAARAHLLERRCSVFGYGYVGGALDGLRALSKTGVPEWRLEALLAKDTDRPSV